jgi:aminoglycoside phosphotransferase (APT) family kinase protein
VNLTLLLGPELVLRLPRTSGAEELLAKESQVIPLVRDAGVPTPELIGYDATRQHASVPYMVLRRARGETLAARPLDRSGRRRTLGALGEILRALHEIRRQRVGPLDALPEPYTFSLPELLDRLVEAGEIGGAQHVWLREQFERLRPEGPSLTDPVLLHRDVIPSNVMVDDAGEVTALLDWGCAEWGSPARDLVGLPLEDLPDLLSGYRADDRSDLELERDALWYHLYLALARLLKEPSTSEDRNWAAPRSATLLDLLAFASGAGTQPWPDILRARSAGGPS